MTDYTVKIKSVVAPKIVDKAAKRAQITRAAADVFARKGFQGALVEEIADAAGISKGTVYGYFKNKEELFYATFQAFQAEIVAECMTAIAAEGSVRDKLKAFLLVTMTQLQAHIELFPLTLELWAAASSGSARERFKVVMENLYREFRTLVAELVQAGKANGEFRTGTDAQAVAAWLVGGLDGLMLQYWFDQSLSIQTWSENFLALVLRGIARDTDHGESK
jgi:AcrR family transcriptional regulator